MLFKVAKMGPCADIRTQRNIINALHALLAQPVQRLNIACAESVLNGGSNDNIKLLTGGKGLEEGLGIVGVVSCAVGAGLYAGAAFDAFCAVNSDYSASKLLAEGGDIRVLGRTGLDAGIANLTKTLHYFYITFFDIFQRLLSILRKFNKAGPGNCFPGPANAEACQSALSPSLPYSSPIKIWA